MSLIWIVVIIILLILFLFWFIGWQTKSNTNVIVPGKYSIQHMQQVPDKQYTLYFFYNKSCPHCSSFQSIWSNLESILQNSLIKTVGIDCSDPANERLCFYYNITKVPKLVLVTPTKHVEYNGNRRTIEDIQQFLNINL